MILTTCCIHDSLNFITGLKALEEVKSLDPTGTTPNIGPMSIFSQPNFSSLCIKTV